MNHEDYREMIAFDALDALDADDRRALGEHLSACSECRAELDEMREVAAMLAHSVAPVRPSGQLRARILESIRTPVARATGGATNPSANGTITASTGGVASAATPSTAEASNVLAFEKKPRDGRYLMLSRTAFASGAIAASLVIVGLSVALALVWTRSNRTQAELARLAARVNQTEQELTEERRALAREREASALLAAPDARLAALAGTAAAPGAHATVAFDPRTGRALLLASGLPPAPAGKAYQLWFIAGDRPPMPGKAFTIDAQGHATLSDQAPPEGFDAKTFVVTLEPAGGVPAPTGGKYLVGSVS